MYFVFVVNLVKKLFTVHSDLKEWHHQAIISLERIASTENLTNLMELNTMTVIGLLYKYLDTIVGFEYMSFEEYGTDRKLVHTRDIGPFYESR